MKILITAGPTREAIDPVRFLSNRSSGRMGYALAHAFAHAQHQVLLISGPTALEVPDHVDFIPIESAEEMFVATCQVCSRYDVVICCAAVSDYRPVQCATQKIKKNAVTLSLELERTPDVLGSLRSRGFTGALIGFAAETQDLELQARRKLDEKGCDLIIANDVSQPGVGFDSEDNELLLVDPLGSIVLPRATKSQLAHQLVPIICDIAFQRQRMPE